MTKQNKDYYTTTELVNEPWFPIKSIITVKKLIKIGKIEAVDISTNPKFERYRITKNSAEQFIKKQKLINN